MSTILRFSILILFFSFASCAPEKVCSGLNPVIGTYNTPQKIRKGKRSLHSGPEKEAYKRRTKQMKKSKRGGSFSGSKKGGFSFHIGGRGRKSGGGGGGNIQQKN